MSDTVSILDRLLDPVSRALSPEAARRLLEVRADAETQSKMDELAERCAEGLLTPDERSEYEALVNAGNVIAVLQAKARAIVAAEPPAA
jgi:hypothetical protein